LGLFSTICGDLRKARLPPGTDHCPANTPSSIYLTRKTSANSIIQVSIVIFS